jgi:hypothetical protein
VRSAFVCLLLAAIVPASVYAKDLAAFSLIQQECVRVGDITFGPGGRWPYCRITQARWFTTIVKDNLDFYQVQYCLAKQADGCDERALVLFSNRAYKPVARLVMARIDRAGTEYDNPQVVKNAYGYVMVVSAHAGGGAMKSTDFYLWQNPDWKPIDARSWLKDLAKRIPKGTSIRKGVSPNVETMTADAPLYRQSDGDCCPNGGNAHIGLAIEKGRFVVKSVTMDSAAAGGPQRATK